MAGLLPLLRRQPQSTRTTERVVAYPEPRPIETVATPRPAEHVERVERVERIDPDDTRDRSATRR